MDENISKKVEEAIDSLEPGECIGHYDPENSDCRNVCVIAARCRMMTESQGKTVEEEKTPLEYFLSHLSENMQTKFEKVDGASVSRFFKDGNNILDVKILESGNILIRIEKESFEIDSLETTNDAEEVYNEIMKMIQQNEKKRIKNENK